MCLFIYTRAILFKYKLNHKESTGEHGDITPGFHGQQELDATETLNTELACSTHEHTAEQEQQNCAQVSGVKTVNSYGLAEIVAKYADKQNEGEYLSKAYKG